MKINVTKSILLNELSVAAKFRGREGKGDAVVGTPYIALIASVDGLTIKATDKIVYYENVLPLQIVGEEELEEVHVVNESGQVALTKKFEDILRKFPSEKVDIIVTDNKITLSSDSVNAQVSTLDIDFPAEPSGQERESINSPKSFFEHIIHKTGFAAEEKDTRPILKGVNISGDGNTFTVIATDSFRLAKYEVDQTIKIDNITIPARPFADALDSFSDDGKVKLIPLDNYVKLEQEDKKVYILLLDDKYPDTSKLVNISDTASQLKVNSKELINAIDRAIPFAKNDKGRPVVHLEMIENEIKVYSTAEDGSMTSNISIIDSNGIPVTEMIVLNAKFMMEAIKSHNCKDVTLVIESKAKPIYVISEDESNTQLILPIRY